MDQQSWIGIYSSFFATAVGWRNSFQGSWQQMRKAVSAATKAVATSPLSTGSAGSDLRPRTRLIKTKLSPELTYVRLTCGGRRRRQCPSHATYGELPACRRRKNSADGEIRGDD